MTLLHAKSCSFQFETTLRVFPLLFIILALSGCASSGVKVELSTIEPAPPEKAKIVVIRPDQTLGWAVNLLVVANDKKAAILPNASYTIFSVEPGKLTLIGDKENSNSLLPHIEMTMDVQAGQTYYVAWLTKYSGLGVLNPILVVAIGRSTIHWAVLTLEDAQKIVGRVTYVVTTYDESVPAQ